VPSEAPRDTLGAPVWEGTGDLAQQLNRALTTMLPMGEVVTGLVPQLYALAVTARVAQRPRHTGSSSPTSGSPP
jgi:hypothetical protein